jgi:amino acid transporter
MATTLASDTKSPERHLERRLGLPQSLSLNMTQMCGIGPFITIPLMVAAMGGPQAVFGWIVGAILAICDGLIWAELGASMPGSGGTYVYLREAFQYRSGRLMPFLFVWTAVLFIPLIMSTGVIGIVQYMGYWFPDMNGPTKHAVALLVVLGITAALYRRISTVGKLATVLFFVMIVTVLVVTVAGLTQFSPHRAFDYPPHAFAFGGPFFAGLGAGLLIAIYDYLGYNTAAYLGDEVQNPGRVIPRATVYSIFGIMSLYLVLNLSVVGAANWHVIAKSDSVASLVVEQAWGKTAAGIVTALIIITAAASVFAGLLGGSRVPFTAARDGVFLPWFARLHPRLNFPHISLIVLAVITAIGSFFTLTTVISMLLAVIVLVQAVAQVAAVTILRRRQPSLRRPYKQFLYPIPSIVALVGWVYVYKSAGPEPIVLSLIWCAVGTVVFLVWAKTEHIWPFGPKEIKEEYVDQQKADDLIDVRDDSASAGSRIPPVHPVMP